MSGCNQIVTQSERGRGTNRKRITSQIEYSEVNSTKEAKHPKSNLKGVVRIWLDLVTLMSFQTGIQYFALHKKVGTEIVVFTL